MLGIPTFTGSDMQFWLSLNYVEEGVIKREIQVIGPSQGSLTSLMFYLATKVSSLSWKCLASQLSQAQTCNFG
jgi:hypothetical protein